MGGEGAILPDLKVEKDASKGSTREETARQCGKDAPNPHFAQAASTKHKRNVLTGRNPPSLSLRSGRKEKKKGLTGHDEKRKEKKGKNIRKTKDPSIETEDYQIYIESDPISSWDWIAVNPARW